MKFKTIAIICCLSLMTAVKSANKVGVTKSCLDKMYDGNAFISPTYITESDGDVKFSYRAVGELTYSTDAPVDAGSYELRAELTSGGNYEATIVMMPFQIYQAYGKVEITEDISKTYDGNPVGAPRYETNNQGTEKIEYKIFADSDSTYSETTPKDPGMYMVRVSLTGDKNHTDCSDAVVFEIKAVKDSSETPSSQPSTDNSGSSETPSSQPPTDSSGSSETPSNQPPTDNSGSSETPSNQPSTDSSGSSESDSSQSEKNGTCSCNNADTTKIVVKESESAVQNSSDSSSSTTNCICDAVNQNGVYSKLSLQARPKKKVLSNNEREKVCQCGCCESKTSSKFFYVDPITQIRFDWEYGTLPEDETFTVNNISWSRKKYDSSDRILVFDITVDGANSKGNYIKDRVVYMKNGRLQYKSVSVTVPTALLRECFDQNWDASKTTIPLRLGSSSEENNNLCCFASYDAKSDSYVFSTNFFGNYTISSDSDEATETAASLSKDNNFWIGIVFILIIVLIAVSVFFWWWKNSNDRRIKKSTHNFTEE